MGSDSGHLVVVFPITSSAFGLSGNWFETFAPKLVRPSFLLLTMLLVVSIGMMVLRRFENADLEKKLWNLPVLVAIIWFWPSLVIALKELIDTFNTFLVTNVFAMPWQGFGFPELGQSGVSVWPTAGLARLLPTLAYWIVYAFYIIFFFFYAVLGPFVLAKGVLFDEIETFLQLVKELVLLMLWQTTLVVVVAFIMPSIVSGQPLPPHPQSNFYFLSIVLGVLIFSTPSLTRKFGVSLESAFVPLGFRWGGAMLGMGLVGKIGAMSLARAGISFEGAEGLKTLRDSLLKMDEFKTRYGYRTEVRDLKNERRELEAKLREYQTEDQKEQEQIPESGKVGLPKGPRSSEDRFLGQLKKAKQEMNNDVGPKK